MYMNTFKVFLLTIVLKRDNNYRVAFLTKFVKIFFI